LDTAADDVAGAAPKDYGVMGGPTYLLEHRPCLAASDVVFHGLVGGIRDGQRRGSKTGEP